MCPDRIVLREFAYFDRQKVEDFLSSIENGLTKETTEVKHEAVAGIGGEVGIPGLVKLGAAFEHKGNRLQELKTATDASLFQRLYVYLSECKLIRRLRITDEKIWTELQDKEMLELDGQIEPSPVQILFEIMKSIISLPENPTSSKRTQPGNEEILRLVLTSRDSANIRIMLDSGDCFFVASLSRDKMRISLHELGAKFSVLCRIQRKMRKGETFDVFSLMPGVRFPRDVIEKFVATLPPILEPMLGRRINVEDFTVTYPAILVTPVAIYR
jgi:hypothetical protein